MSISLNEILLTIPLYEMGFITPFPKDEIIFENVSANLIELDQDKKTIIIIDNNDDWLQFNNKKFANSIIQKQNIAAVIIYNKTRTPLQDEVRELYKKCFFPIVQVTNQDLIKQFYLEKEQNLSYSNLSIELNGFFQKGFMDIATNLAMAFTSPLVFFDNNQQLLWKTGHEEEVNKCLQWFTRGDNRYLVKPALSKESKLEKEIPYVYFVIDVAGQTQLYLVCHNNLSDWQLKFLDKFVGFTAVLFQTDELVRDQNERFKEFFVYELIYRKFESKKVLINQGKTWGWNLEKPHHILVLEIDFKGPHINITDILEEIVYQLESRKQILQDLIHVFTFQDHIVILVEDGIDRTPSERKDLAVKIGEWIEEQVFDIVPDADPFIGVGKWYYDSIDLNKSYQEAKVAIQFGKLWFKDKRIYHMHELGVLHLLTNIHRDLLDDYCQRYLSPLIKSDSEEDTEFMFTLKTYFQHYGVINDIAEAMFIHPNTLRKRIRRIEKLIGMNVQNLEDVLTLMVAVKTYYSFELQ